LENFLREKTIKKELKYLLAIYGRVHDRIPIFLQRHRPRVEKLLEPDEHRNIIIENMRFLVEDKKVIIYEFVIVDSEAFSSIGRSNLYQYMVPPNNLNSKTINISRPLGIAI